eukprot:TRINITY_DN31960_c0_g1_i1.p2 TRINITY_DN31960_c0_g1~~TRINITY_DN31960_c0_g1_i1.p2  ORF type:complete len:199 (-),score=58.31 TRINITY_DN31960_c0_g1_i1:59-598(-)
MCIRDRQQLQEMHQGHEEHVGELQNQFQQLLDAKLGQVEEMMANQIKTLKANERELRNTLDEKISQMEIEYIRMSKHEELMGLKERSIEKMRQEFMGNENELRNECAQKLRTLEERKKSELDSLVQGHRSTVSDLEARMENLSEERKALELKVASLASQTQGAETVAEELERELSLIHI